MKHHTTTRAYRAWRVLRRILPIRIGTARVEADVTRKKPARAVRRLGKAP